MSTSTINRPPTFDHLKKNKQPTYQTVRLFHDSGLVDQVTALEDELGAVDLALGTVQSDAVGKDLLARKAALEASLAEARQACADSSTLLTFRSIGRTAYDLLVAAHPPTPEETQEYQDEYGKPAPYNHKTFSIALVAASCQTTRGVCDFTEDEVRELFAEWNTGEIVECWQAALVANTRRATADLGKVFG